MVKSVNVNKVIKVKKKWENLHFLCSLFFSCTVIFKLITYWAIWFEFICVMFKENHCAHKLKGLLLLMKLNR